MSKAKLRLVEGPAASGAGVPGQEDLSKSALLRKWYDLVWHQGDLEAIGTFLTPDTLVSGSVAVSDGITGEYQVLVGTMRNLFRSIHVSISRTVENGDWLAAHLEVSGTRGTDGEPVNFTGQVMVRFDGRRFAEFHSNFDHLLMFEQLGQLPPDAFAVCTTGARLTWS